MIINKKYKYREGNRVITAQLRDNVVIIEDYIDDIVRLNIGIPINLLEKIFNNKYFS